MRTSSVWANAEFIKDNFIPLVLNGDCTRQEMTATFMKRLKGHFSNETAVATPSGKMLSAWAEDGLKRWKALPKEERTRLEDLGAYVVSKDPAPPEGGLVLKVFARPLTRNSAGVWEIYRNPKAHLSQEPGRDFLWLTATEWKSLVPASARTGDLHAVPPGIVDRLCRRYLIDLVRIGGEGGPRGREQVIVQELALTVEDAGSDRIRLRLDGSARYRSRGPENGTGAKEGREDAFRLLGYLDYDVRAEQFRRFDVIALCETGHYDEIGKKLQPLGIAFELTPAKEGVDRVRPHSLYHDYFGKK
jgi:hypothetical protein